MSEHRRGSPVERRELTVNRRASAGQGGRYTEKERINANDSELKTAEYLITIVSLDWVFSSFDDCLHVMLYK